MASKFKGQGKGRKQVACTLPGEMYHKLLLLAEASGTTPSDYARKAIIKTVQERIRFEEIEHAGAIGPIVVGNPIAQIPKEIPYGTIEEIISARAAEEPEQTQKRRRKTG